LILQSYVFYFCLSATFWVVKVLRFSRSAYFLIIKVNLVFTNIFRKRQVEQKKMVIFMQNQFLKYSILSFWFNSKINTRINLKFSPNIYNRIFHIWYHFQNILTLFELVIHFSNSVKMFKIILDSNFFTW